MLAGGWSSGLLLAGERRRSSDVLTSCSGSPFLPSKKSPPAPHKLLPPLNRNVLFCRQFFTKEVSDLLTSRSSSGSNSSHTDFSGGIFLSLQPMEETVRTIKGMGLAPNTNFKAAQGHLASNARCVLMVHFIDPLLLLRYCITRRWGFFFHSCQFLMQFLAITYMCYFLPLLVFVYHLKRIWDFNDFIGSSPTRRQFMRFFHLLLINQYKIPLLEGVCERSTGRLVNPFTSSPFFGQV